MASLADELAAITGAEHATGDVPAQYLTDATESRALRGQAAALVKPGSPEEVAAVVALCHERGAAIVPRGGGTGFAGGAVPQAGAVVVSLERLDRIRSLEPAQWRMEAEAGVTTETVRRRARESGLLYPVDPGAAEQSQIGGNVATNAGGPHAFKYGVTGAWVTGVEAVLAPGELVRAGGTVRKDVAGYDLARLLVGSEGTLGIVTAVHLRLIPAPAAVVPLAAVYPDAATGCAAIDGVLAAGLEPATLEYLDGATLAAAGGSFPAPLPPGAGFMVLAEADGSEAEATRLAGELREVLSAGALAVHEPSGRGETEALWRWRGGVSIAVTAKHGGKVSEDIAVPVERLEEAIRETLEIGARHELDACSWGHAGDGNLHSTFMLDAGDPAALARSEAAAEELFTLALRFGGTVSGEHGVGLVKRDALARQLSPAELRAARAIKDALDPAGLFNPGKKLPGGIRNATRGD
jgi:glycolate oxidase subunit GlcD